MTENEAIKIATHCLGVQAEQEVCEECDIYGNCHTDCKDVAVVAIKALEEIQQYRKIGTVEECRMAVEKQKPKEPTVLKQRYSDSYNCPKCGRSLILKCGTDWFGGQHYKSCPNCGQAIRWDENLEETENEQIKFGVLL